MRWAESGRASVYLRKNATADQVAAIERARNGQEIIQPKPQLNIATNFLYMMKGEMPDEFDAHVLDVALILQADHELNASTFTARVVAGTLADMYSAVTAALGALSGPLHGGPAMCFYTFFARDGGDVSNGYCAFGDVDGDRIFTDWDGKNDAL